MYHKIKYIRTSNNQIVVFSGSLQHKEFKHMNPVSAGFIAFGVDRSNNPSCSCYGESVSLGLKSNEEDTELARRQFNMFNYY